MPAYHGPSLYTIWLYTIHGWLMSVAWGALAPAAILVAYKFKDLPSRGLWFQIHRAMMVCTSLPLSSCLHNAGKSSLRHQAYDLIVSVVHRLSSSRASNMAARLLAKP